MDLLIVEDDKSQLEAYSDAIESLNKNESMSIKTTFESTLEAGMEAIRLHSYDAAIIDLKLSSQGSDLEGKRIVEAINGRLRIPIYIVSASVAQLDIPENALLKKRVRTSSDFRKIIREIKAIYDTGITKFLRRGGRIDEMLTEIFWKHLSQDLEIWKEHNNPDTLLRYIFSYFHEYLEINSSGEFEEYHPSEVYIKPPVKTNYHTGDIIVDGDDFHLLLTPACDMASGKSENFTLIKLKPFNYKELCATGNAKEINKGKLTDFITNKFFRYHYLPSFDGNDGFLADFQDIRSISASNKPKRVAAISSPFIKDIIARFSNYYSRQGQPTFNQKKIVSDLYSQNNY